MRRFWVKKGLEFTVLMDRGNGENMAIVHECERIIYLETRYLIQLFDLKTF